MSCKCQKYGQIATIEHTGMTKSSCATTWVELMLAMLRDQCRVCIMKRSPGVICDETKADRTTRARDMGRSLSDKHHPMYAPSAELPVASLSWRRCAEVTRRGRHQGRKVQTSADKRLVGSMGKHYGGLQHRTLPNTKHHRERFFCHQTNFGRVKVQPSLPSSWVTCGDAKVTRKSRVSAQFDCEHSHPQTSKLPQ